MADTIAFNKASQVWTLAWDADWVTAVSFLGPTRKLAAGNNRGEILLWDLRPNPGGSAPAPVRKLEGHTNAISRLVSTADGRWLISASYDHTIRFWDMQAPAGGAATVVLNARVREEIARRPAGRKVPAPVEVKVAMQQSARTLNGHRDWVTALAMSRDEKVLVSGDDGSAVIVWDRESGKELRRWSLKGWAYAIALSPDSKQVLVSERIPLIFDSGRTDGLKIWDRESGKPLVDLGAAFKGQYISAAAWSPDGKVLALARGGEVDGMNGIVHLVHPASGKKVRSLTTGHLNGATDLLWHPDGKHLASCGRDTTARIWDVAAGKQVAQIGKPRGGQFKDWLHALSFSADGRWLAAGDMIGAVQVWVFGS